MPRAFDSNGGRTETVGEGPNDDRPESTLAAEEAWAAIVFTAVYMKAPKGYAAFVEELPGANTQGATLEEPLPIEIPESGEESGCPRTRSIG